MQRIQLYINGTLADLYKDESISITDSIQNVRDIKKIFTAFSKTFTIPASPTNNKIFQHYYNPDIDGYDARNKATGRIDINHLPFKSGKIRLEGVDMEGNKPKFYRITFFGETINLVDLIGDDKLVDLDWLDNFDQDYTATQVKTLLGAGDDITVDSVTYDDAILVPLISNTTRLFYNDGAGTHDEYFNADGTTNPLGGNLEYAAGAGHIHGVYFKELKYAIRVYVIIKAIEEKYGITFTSDSLLKSTSDARFHSLYLWLHKRKGFPFDVNLQTEQYTGWTFDSSNTYWDVYPSYIYTSYAGTWVYSFLVTRGVAAEAANVYLKANGTIVDSISLTTADTTKTLSGNAVFSSGTRLEIFIEGASSDEFDVDATITDPLGNSDTHTGTTYTMTGVEVFSIKTEMPDMKIIDFLTGLFQMFNLTAYYVDGEIRVIPLDDYYGEGTHYDITNYVSPTNTIDALVPYKTVNFEYAGRKTKLASFYEQENSAGWGSLEYTNVNDVVREDYEIKLPFEHMQFERLINEADGTETDIQVGWFADDKGEAYLGSPLLFYPILQSGGTAISFVEDGSTWSSVSTYYVPSNTVALSASTSDDSIHFNNEFSEYESGNFAGTLFANYYQTYIEEVFNPKARLTKIKAMLPVRILMGYGLNDRVIWNDRPFKINTITTNLLTGESDIELLSDFTYQLEDTWTLQAELQFELIG